MITITVGQRKGGNGKTTSTLNLAHAFARMGKTVLVIDLDDQRSSSSAIATLKNDFKPRTVADLLLDRECTVEDTAVRTEWEGVSLIRADLQLSGAIKTLDSEVGGHLALKEKLDGCTSYDLCIIDTSPSLNTLFVNALCASRYLFVPLSSKYFSLHGLELTLDSMKKVRDRLNKGLLVLAVAFVIHDGRSALSREVVKKSRELYPQLLCQTVINQNILIEEAQVKKQSIFTYASGNRGALQYEALAIELCTRMGI